MFSDDLQILLNNNDWEGSLSYLNKIEEPLSDELLEKKAWCFSRLANYNDAIKIYLILIKKQPNNAKWLYSLGYQYYAQNKFEFAIDYFEKALVVFPEYFKVKYRLAYAYIQLAGTEKQWTKDIFWKAVQQLQDAHKIYKNYSDEQKLKEKNTYAEICALHGKSIMNSMKYIDRAIELLRQSLSLKNDNDVQYQLAKAYYMKKDYRSALAELPTDEKCSFYVLELKSLILSAENKYEESNNILFKLLKFRKKDYIYQRISQNYISIGNYVQALEAALKAVRCDNRNYKNYLLCGKIYKELKQYKSALESLESARDKKQIKFANDEPEAVRLIDEINIITNGNPYNEVDKDVNDLTIESFIKSFNTSRGFGFIKGNKDDYFFHISSIKSTIMPKRGMKVKFEVIETEKGKEAKNIVYS